MDRLCERAFAKLNLTLDVLGKRPDGYHELVTVMQSVGLCDEVYITIKHGCEIRAACTDPALPVDLDNLGGRAAKAFLDHVGIGDTAVDIMIEKHIPDRAGLAGGSSDAAAVIRGLDRLLGTGLSEGELVTIASKVGSDVPFCLLGGTRLCRGRGEVMEALPELPGCVIAIVKPEFSVSTPYLFRKIDETPVKLRPDTRGMLDALGAGELAGICGYFCNVFEQALPERERSTVEEIKSALIDAGAPGAAMTGSGSAVFGVFPAGAEPKIAVPGARVFLTGPVKR